MANDITLKDISNKCNLAISTVSRVLSNKIYNKDTCARVISAINELQNENGNENFIIRKTDSSKRIGILSWGYNIENQVIAFNEIMQGINMASGAGGHFILQMVSNGKYQKGGLIEQAVNAKSVDGIICVGLSDTDENIKFLSVKKIPLIVMNRHIEDNNMNCICLDDKKGGELAIEYMKKRGASRFLALSVNPESSCFRERMRGFKEKAESLNRYIETTASPENLRCKEWVEWLHEQVRKHKIDTIVTVSDSISAAAIDALRSKNMNIPDDISVVGFDNSSICEYTVPKLSSVKSHLKDSGKLAVETLISLMKTETIQSSKILLKPEIVARESTKQ